VRLLLDEHLSPIVARSLRDRGHDVIAVAERTDLRGAEDEAILLAAAAEDRVVVTADTEDFARLGASRLRDRHWHAGIILAPPGTFPRSRDGSGLLIRALDALLADRPDADPAIAEVLWLSRPPDGDSQA
jgi:hypothetical protein